MARRIAATLPVKGKAAKTIQREMKQLEAFPESGRMVPEVGRPEIREVVEAPYRVIYRLTAQRIEVVAVVHARRADVGPTP